MTALLDPRVWLVVLVLCLGSYGSGRWQQWRGDDKRAQAAQLAAVIEARTIEQGWNDKLREVQDAHTDETKRVAAALGAALDRLRNRPKRLPEVAISAGQCDGASGKQLSRDDAEFLARYAAERAIEAANLRSCQAWIETVTHFNKAGKE